MSMRKVITYFIVPLIGTLIFLVLSWPPVNEFMIKQIPDFTYRIITEGLIIFAGIYISNRLVLQYIKKSKN